jgi:hypothetical protein|nr:MAG TPA: Protein of unknown function (DUF739) [Caudoviricetes sp.]
MIINTEQVEAVLMNKAVSGYLIEKETGISSASISRLRNEKKRFGDLSIDTAIKVQQWIDMNENIN